MRASAERGNDAQQNEHTEYDHEHHIPSLRRARALLFPIQWDEPFGLVMLEAMACGTPVIAFDRGSVGDVVVHGSTGWICQNADEMAAVMGDLAPISSWACRRHVEEHFSVERTASDYERVYRSALSDRDEATRG